jgi:hypothetical protein
MRTRVHKVGIVRVASIRDMYVRSVTSARANAACVYPAGILRCRIRPPIWTRRNPGSTSVRSRVNGKTRQFGSRDRPQCRHWFEVGERNWRK